MYRSFQMQRNVKNNGNLLQYYKKLIKVLTKRKRSSSEYISLIVMSIFQ